MVSKELGLFLFETILPVAVMGCTYCSPWRDTSHGSEHLVKWCWPVEQCCPCKLGDSQNCHRQFHPQFQEIPFCTKLSWQNSLPNLVQYKFVLQLCQGVLSL